MRAGHGNYAMERIMQELNRDLWAQLVGGREVVQPGTGTDTGGGPIGGGVGGGGAYDIYAVGVEGGPPAIVKIDGAVALFDTSITTESSAPFLEQHYQGMWVAEKGLTAEHQQFDETLKWAVRGTAAAAAFSFVSGALEGAGMGAAAGPWGALAGLVVGGAAGIGAWYLMERDHHPTGPGEVKKGYIDRNGVPRQAPGIAPADDDNSHAFYASRQGSNVMQIAA
jgi:hypothetical protein